MSPFTVVTIRWASTTAPAAISKRRSGSTVNLWATVMGGNTYYVFADNLGSPCSLVQASNNAEVWRWDSDPYGNAAPSGQVTYNMRFPGQTADIETGLFQNGFRRLEGHGG